MHELATIVLADEPLADVLGRVTALARDAIPPAEDVSMTLVEGDRAYTAAHTGQLSLDADELQYENGYGPCMDAGRGGLTLLISDMTAEQRWPAYTPAAAERGVGSSLSVPLPLQATVIGAINIYSTKAHSFDDPQVALLGEEVARYAAVAVANAKSYANARAEAAQMAQAMSSRAVIEQAKGVVMATRHVSADDAFALLIEASQRTNRKLREIARDITESAARRR
nr:GAF and ANTAR domain-containing protein [Motilibacter aurantiacus]